MARKSKINRATHKVCIKCRKAKARINIFDPAGTVVEKKAFGDHNSEDGLQSICYSCKNIANNKARDRNVTARIRHHTATRCLTQLGELAPDQLSANLEQYLGYRISTLVKHLSSELRLREGAKRKLRDALNEGYHIDHRRPLSSYKVVAVEQDPIPGTLDPRYIDWDVFRECWSVSNLVAIPAAENLAKGAKYHDVTDQTQSHTQSQA